MNTLALVIDSDNIHPKYIKHIVRFCEVHGILTIKNAYGDWTQPELSPHCLTITELGVNCIQQNRIGKNATDFRLAMDVALMLEKGEADIYFLVSADTGFAAVCERIHQKGAKVIGIGSENQASSELRKACTLFFDIEEIVKTQSEPSAKSAPAAKPKAKAQPKVETKPKPVIKPKVETKPKTVAKPKVKAKPKTKAQSKVETKPKIKAAPKLIPPLEMLLEAYHKAPQENGWAHLGQIGEALRQIDSQFEERFAKRKLMTRYESFPEKFEVSKDRVRVKKMK